MHTHKGSESLVGLKVVNMVLGLIAAMMIATVLALALTAKPELRARLHAMKIAASALVMIALAGCGSDGKDMQALALTPVPPGKARIKIQRSSTIVYAGCPATIMRGSEKVADIANGGQALFDVPAGATVIETSCWSYPGKFSVKFTAVAGQQYAMELAPREGSIGTAVLFGAIGGALDASVNENSGAFELKGAGGSAVAGGDVADVAGGSVSGVAGGDQLGRSPASTQTGSQTSSAPAQTAKAIKAKVP